MKNIYIFSGLGADERVFQRLEFPGFISVYIKWIDPHVNESMESYASRISGQITTENPILIGLSFGGMMAVEVAKQINTEKIILIASAKTRKEIPTYYRLSGKLKLHRLLPTKFIKQSNAFTNWIFGATADFDKALLKQILNDTDPRFFRWAIDQITHWKNSTEPDNIIHIHGTSDHILPYRFVKCDFAINRGGHFMTINKSAELNAILKKELMQS